MCLMLIVAATAFPVGIPVLVTTCHPNLMLTAGAVKDLVLGRLTSPAESGWTRLQAAANIPVSHKNSYLRSGRTFTKPAAYWYPCPRAHKVALHITTLMLLAVAAVALAAV